MDFIVGTKSIDPDIMRTELFKRIEEKYKDDSHGFFKFAGGVEIGLEGNQPMKLWYFKYTGDDMCWWCPGGADQIIQKWREDYGIDGIYLDFNMHEGTGNYHWLLETDILD